MSRAPAIVTCKCCGRVLTDPVSVMLRVGPVCRIRHKMCEARSLTLPLFDEPAVYSHQVRRRVLAIRDGGGITSVTRDISNVLEELRRQGTPVEQMRIMYRDALGVWDGVAVANGRFSHFFDIGLTDEARARDTLRRMNASDMQLPRPLRLAA